MGIFLLDGIPDHLLESIVRKMTIAEFIRLRRTCKFFLEMCSSMRNAISLDEKCTFSIQRKYVSTCIRLSFGLQKGKYLKVTSSLARSLIEYLKPFRHKYKSIRMSHIHGLCVLELLVIIARELTIRTDQLNIYNVSSIADKGNELKEFVELLQPRTITLIVYPSRIILGAFFPTSIFQGAEKLRIAIIDYGDRELLQVKQKYLNIKTTEVTDRGINQFLREWIHGDRGIKSVKIQTEQDLSVDGILLGLPGVNLLYDSDSHNNSLIGSLDQGCLSQTLRESSFYILIKPVEIFHQFLLRIGRKNVEILEISRPIQAIFYHLEKKQYSAVNGGQTQEICEDCYEILDNFHNDACWS